jgi:hypothetical protein
VLGPGVTDEKNQGADRNEMGQWFSQETLGPPRPGPLTGMDDRFGRAIVRCFRQQVLCADRTRARNRCTQGIRLHV